MNWNVPNSQILSQNNNLNSSQVSNINISNAKLPELELEDVNHKKLSHGVQNESNKN